ncbi:MAG: MBL fold metallo-hydrolase [Actinomycetota bacterium]|nr:MBL fold metallo-hydrolase [Actinomycetota bacterium]
MRTTFEAAPGIHAIDTVMGGREQVTSAYLLRADEPAIVETGPTTSVDALTAGLEELGIGPQDLAHVVVTHIHLDHAGGAGAVAARFPKATVWVHERGAPHLADPRRLVASAERVYGEDLLRQLFGGVDPVPPQRLKPLREGDVISLGGRELETLYTPGHASHHVALADSQTGGIFVGDALGVFLPDVGILRPATPPPEFDLEVAIQSVERIGDRRPPMILFSHFGPAQEVSHLCSLAVSRMRRWTSLVEEALERTDRLEEVIHHLRQGTSSDARAAGAERQAAIEDRYELLSSYQMNAMGLMKYLQGRGGQESAASRSATS